MDLDRRSGERYYGTSQGRRGGGHRPVPSEMARAPAGLRRPLGRVSRQPYQAGDLGSHLVKGWLPDDIVFIESVPKTSVGKFNKRALREQFKDYSFSPAENSA